MHYTLINGIQGIFGTVSAFLIIMISQLLFVAEPYNLNLTYEDVCLLSSMGFLGAFAQFFYIQAIQRETASRISCLILLGIAFGYIFDVVFF